MKLHRSLLRGLLLWMAAGLLAFGAARAWADLEWITGGVPQNSQSSGSSTAVVRDAPGEAAPPPTTGNQDVVMGLLTTCSSFANQYPADSRNYFFLGQNDQICFYAYFLMKPSSRIHTVTVDWYSPNNIEVAKYSQEFHVGFTDRLLTFQDQTYQWYLVQMVVGTDHMHTEYGQTGLPDDPGLYTIHLSIDGQLAGMTFFYVKEQPIQKPAPIPTVAPAGSGANDLMPMSTPIVNSPIPQNIHSPQDALQGIQ